MVLLRYTMMRILLFAGCTAAFVLLGLDVLWAAVAGALASMVIAYFLLRPDRDRIAAGLEHSVEERMARRRDQVDSERAAED
ncbi:DUF4229 domain-containing protein [Ornithinimicrobium flavum]|uniref:DUF4229 domain-containing protein n=1 Tax=Ornithinimicrobium flavum TaxID=1288636 RepID=UPI0010702454|nr:DUF4229 domain-containing protein [Ornithinimicrobium flavum]